VRETKQVKVWVVALLGTLLFL